MLDCELVTRDARYFAGLSFSGPFPQSFPSEAETVQQQLGSGKCRVLIQVNPLV